MDYATVFLDQNRAFGELIRRGDPAAPVPTCPDWTLSQLFRHVGRGHRWAAQIVAERRDHPLDPRTVADGKPPADPDAAIGWLQDGAQQLVDAVAQTGAHTAVWTFLGPRPANWWLRRRLHEVTVHRADAGLATGRGPDIGDLTAELAADGITEWLVLVAGTFAATSAADEVPAPLGQDQTMHLHATDPGLGAAGEWTIGVGPAGITWSHEHGKGTIALRGAATDLLLALLRRVAVADTEVAVFGDATVWQRWLDSTPF